MTRAADVFVLGAGVVGVTTAYALARRGLRVAIVDRRAGPGLETSYANGGQLSYAYTDALASPGLLRKLPFMVTGGDPAFDLTLSADPAFIKWGLGFLRNCTSGRFSANTLAALELAMESRGAMAALLARHPIAFAHEVAGKLHLYHDPAAFAAAGEIARIKAQSGVIQHQLTPAEACAIEPSLASAKGLVGAVYSPDDAVGDPRRFCVAMLKILVEDYGVETHFDFDVAAFDRRDGEVYLRGAQGEDIRAAQVAVCLGIGAPRFLKRMGISVPIWPMKGYSFTAPPGDAAPRISITDTARKIVFCRLGGEIRVAGIAQLGNWDSEVDPAQWARLVDAAQASLPGAALYDRAYGAWAGLRPMTPRSLPIIARPRPDILLNVGHGMLGWTFAMGAAERTANLLSPDLRQG